MAPDQVRTYTALSPLGWLYGSVADCRNRLFDCGLLPQEQFDVPIISVGNLTVGGTGKTPHVEYIVRLLSDSMRVAVLSRGYRRRTKGFVLAGEGSTADDIGDEPLQIWRKYGDRAAIAVDADRRHGIHTFMGMPCPPQAIVLDDAFQHRYVKAGLSILLTDYHRLLTRDKVMPAGRLREPRKGMLRAHVIIVTKCPPQLTQEQAGLITAELSPADGQRVYYSTTDYAPLQPMTGAAQPAAPIGPDTHVLLLTGIANPRPMIQELGRHTRHIETMSFADHHRFTADDLSRIATAFERQPEPRVLITTEKDAARLTSGMTLPPEVASRAYVMPISVRMLHGRQAEFDRMVTDFVHNATKQESHNDIQWK